MKTQLFKGYNQIVYLASFIVFLITVVLVILQFNALFTHEKDQINNYFEHSLSKLTHITSSTAEHLSTLRTESEVYLNNPLLQVPHPLFSYLKDNSKENYFHLDSLPAGFSASETGNLTGLANLKNLQDSSKLAINMAFYLNPLFKSTMQRIPNATLIYLLRHDFYHIYPFTFSKDFRLTSDIENILRIYEQPVMQSQNPQKKEVWTKIYSDLAGGGLMVSALMPIYKKDNYFGLIGLDLTLDSLNSLILGSQRHIGNMFVVNSFDQIVAHPHLVASADSAIRLLKDAVPVAYEQMNLLTVKDLERYTAAELQEIGDSYLYYNKIENSDWKMVYIVHKSDLRGHILKEAGLRLLFVLANVILVLILTFYITQKRFIKPAQQLVDLIQSENLGKKISVEQVPKDWQTSFDIIVDIFTKNRHMIEELKKDNIFLEEKVKKRTKILEKRNQEILLQQKDIEAKNRTLNQINDNLLANEQKLKTALLSIEVQKEKITDGIRYAQTIQEAILPTSEMIKASLRDFFIIYKPKDIVSGDLYWTAHLDDLIFITVIDCTGHGVSGAFLSIIAYSLLNQIIHEKRIFEPEQILQELNDYMLKIFHQTPNNDGLAIGICQIKLAEDVQKIHFVYANAKTPCYYFLNKDLQTIKRENNVIGGFYKHEKTFSQTNLLLDRKTTFYIFTDGYADQGNEEKQRIGSEKVKNLIFQYSDYPLQDQKKYFEDYLNEHQGIAEQRDDVTVFAFKV